MKKIILSLLLIHCSIALYALENSVAVSVLQSMAESFDPTVKLAALESIEDLLLKGSDDEDGITSVAGYLATEGVIKLRIDDMQVGNDHPHVRYEAARVLGLSRSKFVTDYLTTVLLNEPSSHILASAMRSCAQAAKVNKKLCTAFYLILTGKKQVYRSEDIVYETLTTIQSIQKRDDSLLTYSKVREGLSYVSDRDTGYSKITCNLAKEILSSY